MSSSNSLRFPLTSPNVDALTFGDSSLYGYDSSKHSLMVYSLTESNHFPSFSIQEFHLSLSPPAIRRLILNPDQTILALISTQTAYLVYLPQSISSSSSHTSSSSRCPVSVLPETKSSLIDFLWLSPRHFVVVRSLPSPSECHLYVIRPSHTTGIQHLQSFSLDSSSTIKNRTSGTSTTKISLDQTMRIVKLDSAKRKLDQFTSILLFALKENGDIFLLDIDQNQLLNSEHVLCPEFLGPLLISPSRTDNYGSDYRHSNLLCLSSSPNPLVLFTSSPYQLNQCLLLNKSLGDYQLFTIDALNLPRTDSSKPTFQSLLKNPLNPNVYYVYDSSLNIYSIDISWLEKIEQKQKSLPPTTIQHLHKCKEEIEQLGLIQSNQHGQWLTILTKRTKELIFIRPSSVALPVTLPREPPPSPIVRRKPVLSNVFSRIESILAHDSSVPIVPPSATNLSNRDLWRFLTHLSEEYLDKQQKAQTELENKQRFLNDTEQLQRIAKQELDCRMQRIEEKFRTVNEHYQLESSRRMELSSKVDDHFSLIGQHTSVASNAEIFLHQQLQRYQNQLNVLEKKISLLTPFISKQSSRNDKIDSTTMNEIQKFLAYYRRQIDQMKEQLDTTDQSN